MSRDVNSVHVIGRLTRDPELQQTPNGVSVAKFGIASNRQVNGEERTDFFEVVTWQKQAETIAAHLTKGRKVFVEGRLTQEQWDSSAGEKRSRVIITGESVTFLDFPKDK